METIITTVMRLLNLVYSSHNLNHDLNRFNVGDMAHPYGGLPGECRRQPIKISYAKICFW